MFVKFSYFCQLFSLRTGAFSAKLHVLGHMKPGRTHRSRSRCDPCTLERVTGAHKFFLCRIYVARLFPGVHVRKRRPWQAGPRRREKSVGAHPRRRAGQYARHQGTARAVSKASWASERLAVYPFSLAVPSACHSAFLRALTCSINSIIQAFFFLGTLFFRAIFFHIPSI